LGPQATITPHYKRSQEVLAKSVAFGPFCQSIRHPVSLRLNAKRGIVGALMPPVSSHSRLIVQILPAQFWS
jgi:hypothetical protein